VSPQWSICSTTRAFKPFATSDEVQGLVAQGRTIQETIEIARDVVKKLIEAQSDAGTAPLPPAREVFDYPLIVAT
jgi:predicted RNase H-like HicB family nuclease